MRKTDALAWRFGQLLVQTPCAVVYCWCGTFAETPEGLPCIGVHPRVPHMFCGLGCGGNGITFNVITTEIMRDLVCKGRSRDADLFHFDRRAVL